MTVRRSVRRRAPLLAVLCVVALLTPLLTRLPLDPLHGVHWVIDLASHWQWPYVAGLVFFGVVAAASDRRWALVLLALPLPWLTAMPGAPATPDREATLRVATANVGVGNSDPAPLAAWLATRAFDVVALSEVTPGFADALGSIPGYRYRHVVARRGPFGLALLSRNPLHAAHLVPGPDGIPRIEAVIGLAGRRVAVTVVHPMPPLAPRYHTARDALLRDAAARAGHPGQGPGILLGDLNASPWSSGARGPADAGYHRATSLAPTWPAVGRGLAGIPIDQVLVSRHLSVIAAGVGPPIGSDHLPAWASLGLLPE